MGQPGIEGGIDWQQLEERLMESYRQRFRALRQRFQKELAQLAEALAGDMEQALAEVAAQATLPRKPVETIQLAELADQLGLEKAAPAASSPVPRVTQGAPAAPQPAGTSKSPALVSAIDLAVPSMTVISTPEEIPLTGASQAPHSPRPEAEGENRERAARKQEEAARQEREEARKQAETARREREEAARKKAEATRQKREVAARKQADDARQKREEAARKQAEEARREREEAARRQAEAVRRQREEAARKQAETRKKQEEEARKKRQEAQQEAARKQAEAQKREEEARKRAEAERKAQEEAARKQQEAAAREAEAEQERAAALSFMDEGDAALLPGEEPPAPPWSMDLGEPPAPGPLAPLSDIRPALDEAGLQLPSHMLSFLDRYLQTFEKLDEKGRTGEAGGKILCDCVRDLDRLAADLRAFDAGRAKAAVLRAAADLVRQLQQGWECEFFPNPTMTPEEARQQFGFKAIQSSVIPSKKPGGTLLRVIDRGLQRGGRLRRRARLLLSSGDYSPLAAKLEAAQDSISNLPAPVAAKERIAALNKLELLRIDLAKSKGRESETAILRYFMNALVPLEAFGDLGSPIAGLREELASRGLEEVEVPVGEPFGHHLSGQLYEQRSILSDEPAGQIVRVIQPGYVAKNGTCVQKAVVGVSSGLKV